MNTENLSLERLNFEATRDAQSDGEKSELLMEEYKTCSRCGKRFRSNHNMMRHYYKRTCLK